MNTGYLALILHAHLPFVRHPEHEHFLEEDWFFEAVTESYIPLLRMMQRLLDDSVPFKLTMSVTPTLCAMLQDKLLHERYVQHLDNLIDLTEREQKRNRDHPQLRALSILQQQVPQAARAQILIGRDVYVDLFGAEPTGFWLPECAYISGLDPILQEANIRWFVLDAHGLLFGKPRPRQSIYAPCYTPAGPAAFARDSDSSRQVWSAHEGYPGDPAYRDFYRDVGFDLPVEHLGPIARGRRKFSGVKYHRITGRGSQKQLYDRTAAENAAAKHARHFLEHRRQQLREISDLDFDPIVVAPFDAELFGHWWFEGPLFLEQFIRQAANEKHFCLTTPSEYLAGHTTQQIIEPAASTWGENGHLGVWLDPSNAWIYPHLHTATQRMSEAARAHAENCSLLADRVLKQLTRELLLAQSSDWAFLMKTGTAREYATKRTIDHLARFSRLHDQFVTDEVDDEFLCDCESCDNLFPNVNWRYYI